MTLETRPTALYRTSGERAVRVASPAQAAWAFALRKSRRNYGKRAGADVRKIGSSGDGDILFEAEIGERGLRCFWYETIYICVRRA